MNSNTLEGKLSPVFLEIRKNFLHKFSWEVLDVIS
jgi:hypothetical protein